MAALTPCKQKHPLKVSDNWTAILFLTRVVVGKLAQAGFGKNILVETRGSKLKEETGTIINRCFDKIFLQLRTQII